MSHKPTNTNTELARERNRAAAERTLMAWIRTCLSLISFGFGIDRIFYAIEKTSVGENIDPERNIGQRWTVFPTVRV